MNDRTPPAEPFKQLSSAVLLQRRRPNGDCSKWRTVLRLTSEYDMALAQDLVALAGRIEPAVEWRCAPDASCLT